MRTHYFQSAWEDIKHSRGWFGKILLLALLNFIPILGQIMILSYLYGWAREIAWGIHEPAPAKIIANDDGKFWWRGWLIVVLTIAFMAVPFILDMISSSIAAYSYEWTIFGPQLVSDPGLSALKGVLSLVAFVLGLGLLVFSWVGCMRVAIYNRLSAGFQFKKMWAMLRRDGAGMGRIFLMDVLFTFIMGCILMVVLAVFLSAVLAVSISAMGGIQNLAMIAQLDSGQAILVAMQALLAAGGVGFVLLLVFLYLAGIAAVFIQMLVIRALGYWTMQFEVPLWGGQDDPLPFELQKPPEPARASAPEAPAAPPMPATAAPVQPGIPPVPAAAAPTAPATPQQPAASVAPEAFAGDGMPPASEPAGVGEAAPAADALPESAFQVARSESPEGGAAAIIEVEELEAPPAAVPADAGGTAAGASGDGGSDDPQR